MSKCPIAARSVRGHTLVELVLSLALLSIVFGAVGSAMIFTAQATPSEDSATATLIRDAQVLARMAEDLSLAKYITEQRSEAVTFVMPDRTGDGVPDRVRYAWAGAGGALTYQLNDGSAVPLLQSVDSFGLSYKIQSQTSRVPAVPAATAQETPFSMTTASDDANFRVRRDDWIGQTMQPALAGPQAQYSVDSVRFHARTDGPASGVISVELYAADNAGLPTGPAIDSVEFSESELSGSYAWYEAVFPGAPVFDVGSRFCLVLRWVSGGNAARIEYDRDYGDASPEFIMIETDDGGTTWTQAVGHSMLIELNVTPVSAGGHDGFDLTQQHVVAIAATLQSTAGGRSPLTRTTATHMVPRILSDFWEADFGVSPTTYDLDGDQTPDWQYNGRADPIPASDLDAGVWTAQQPLAIQPAESMSGVTQVDLRISATLNEAQSPTVFGPMHVNAGGRLLPLVTRLQPDGSGGQELLVYNATTTTSPVVIITGLSSGWIDVRLTLLPDEDTLWVKVNGEDEGAVVLSRISDSGERGLWLDGQGAGAKYTEVRVTVGGTYVPVVGGGGS